MHKNNNSIGDTSDSEIPLSLEEKLYNNDNSIFNLSYKNDESMDNNKYDFKLDSREASPKNNENFEFYNFFSDIKIDKESKKQYNSHDNTSSEMIEYNIYNLKRNKDNNSNNVYNLNNNTNFKKNKLDNKNITKKKQIKKQKRQANTAAIKPKIKETKKKIGIISTDKLKKFSALKFGKYTTIKDYKTNVKTNTIKAETTKKIKSLELKKSEIESRIINKIKNNPNCFDDMNIDKEKGVINLMGLGINYKKDFNKTNIKKSLKLLKNLK